VERSSGWAEQLGGGDRNRRRLPTVDSAGRDLREPGVHRPGPARRPPDAGVWANASLVTAAPGAQASSRSDAAPTASAPNRASPVEPHVTAPCAPPTRRARMRPRLVRGPVRPVSGRSPSTSCRSAAVLFAPQGDAIIPTARRGLHHAAAAALLPDRVARLARLARVIGPGDESAATPFFTASGNDLEPTSTPYRQAFAGVVGRTIELPVPDVPVQPPSRRVAAAGDPTRRPRDERPATARLRGKRPEPRTDRRGPRGICREPRRRSATR